MFNSSASYTIVFENDKFIFIVDNDQGLSVTNDAENVCRKLLALTGRSNKRIIYRDTDGRWDELVHSGFEFSHFFSITDKEVLDLVKQVELRIF